jgi:hypothetical protein
MGFMARLQYALCVIDIVDIIVSASGDIMYGVTTIEDRGDGQNEHKLTIFSHC